MTSINRSNFVILCLLVLIISLGCGQLNSSDSGEKSENSSNNNSSESGNREIALEIDDENSEPADENSEPADEQSTDSGTSSQTSKRTSTVVKFGKGKTSAGFNDAVIRGERHTYVLGASAGQTMTIRISSTEDNASFYVLSPKGRLVGNGTEEDGVTSFNEILSESGNYKIIVSPTRGNATFKINFNVSAKEKTPPNDDGGNGSGGITKVVKFRKGGTSAAYSNSVVRGDRDTYILGASGGQTMSVSISSLEDNAVFDVISPGGSLLASERTSWTGRLPQNGKYRVIVGGTRGNASYKVGFSIR